VPTSRAGLADVVALRPGWALEALPRLAAEEHGPFNLIFIDADKPRTPEYVMWALTLSRRGSLIIADTVVRNGAVVDADSDDPTMHGGRRFIALRAAEPRVSATVIQTMGSKRYDGFSLAVGTA